MSDADVEPRGFESRVLGSGRARVEDWDQDGGSEPSIGAVLTPLRAVQLGTCTTPPTPLIRQFLYMTLSN